MTVNGKPIVTVLYPEQHDQAADSLGRAFINDPTFKSIVPDVTDPAERARRLPDLFRAMLAIERRSGQPVFGVIDDNGRVVAAAMTEGVGHPGTLGLLATGLGQMPRLIRALGWGGLIRALNLFSVLAANHPKEPHLYLQVLGCDPPFQGKGYGKALLDRLALEARARPQIAGVYLETATEANVAFYSSRGYEILGELYPLGVRTWRMYQRRRQG
ncbi:MAG: GNAT family N-acetyltransferase [Candidatus Binatus sp.]